MAAPAQALLDEIAARGEEIERTRHLPPDLAQKLAQAGLFRLCVPRSLGGGEASPRQLIEAIEAVSAADGSAGWCVMIGATSGASAAYLDPAVAAEIHGNVLGVSGGVFAPRGKAELAPGGYRVSGRWQWASGNSHCQWMKGGCLITEGGKPRLLANGTPEARMIYFKREQIKFHDTWHVSGLCGTGSNDMEVADLFVPAAYSVSIADDKPREKGPLYAFPIFGLLALGVAAVALGIARGAIVAFTELAGAKVPTGSRRVLAERPATQADLARAEALVQSARAFMLSVVEKAWADAQAGRALTVEIRAQLRLAATAATEQAARAVDLIYGLGGGSSVYKASPLQRAFRDIHVATQHMMVAPATYEVIGRTMLGLPTDASLL